MNVDRGVPEVWGSKYDVRELLRAAYYAVDKKPIDDLFIAVEENDFQRKDCLKESNKSCGRNRSGDFAKGKWIAPVREVIHRYGFKQNISDGNISKSKERGSMCDVSSFCAICH